MNTWVKRSGIMLFNPYEKKRFDKWPKPVGIQPKFDGYRCRCECERNYKLISSELNIFSDEYDLSHIQDELTHIGFTGELDGELWAPGMKSYDVSHALASNPKSLQYYLFDLVDEYSPQIDRLDKLYEYPDDSSIIRLVPTYFIYTEEEVFEYLNMFMNAGLEGFILRNLVGKYVRRRSIDGMKFKPGREDTYTIIGVTEGNGKHAGKLGSLQFVGDDGSEGSVGTGFTDKQREHYWTIRTTLPGRLVKVAYQHLTAKNGVPRSSVFVEVI